ncbi:thioredoxin family protein [Thermomonas sp. RSS23]|uniref:Thioredoxin family protein n=1 Tax=Thermomonas beijingensis TaxID=2872701 RepID=A0ABS7TAC6_9GAMM|nr:protein-disulfide reductase DsbD [Thermomonas beijingensis]MBZ4184809.1 thioredoxin family protein [Thermomonas beijingensis]
MTRLSFRPCRWLAALALAAALPAAATADVDLPPVDQVFVLSASATAHDRVDVRWQIAKGYYLYRHRTSVKTDPGFANATLALPSGDKHRDEFFGDVETYRGQLIGTLSGQPAATATSVRLTVKYQGCADAGVCYPPQTRTLTVALPAADDAAPGLGFAKKSGGLFGLGDPAGAVNAAPLPPEQAFGSEVIALDGNTLLLRLTPANGYYLYRDKLSANLVAADGLSAALPAHAQMPKASAFKDEHFGQVQVYFTQVEIPLVVNRSTPRAANGNLIVGLQGCQTEGICYAPMTRTLAVHVPAGEINPPLRKKDSVPKALAGDTAPAAPLPPAVPPTSRKGGVIAPTLATADAARSAPPQHPIPSLLPALLLALLGGLILNLMPCVLPVLSLKVLSLAQSGASRQTARRHALAYTAGVLASFAALGGLILALRSGGIENWISWGFQLQFPRMVAVLGLLMFMLGLSLSGMWYASIRISGRAGALAQGSGVRADFFTGVLAVVLSTPCTAPFMGAALAYAFVAPTLAAMLVFLTLGLGLALPFLLIAFVPALARLLPKPGAWMETLKQLLAFPMYATAAWLVWVLAQQRGADAAGLWMGAAILLALAAWAWTHARQHARRWPLVLAVLALATTAWPLYTIGTLPKPMSTHVQGELAVAYTEPRLAELRTQGRVVFVNITADWCVSCKANEKAVFARDRFRAALKAADAAYMIGDHTNIDPAITAYLHRYGAVGLPLYVVYPRGGGEGKVLPVLLTPGIVEDALREAAR